jgi:hypothetical protein
VYWQQKIYFLKVIPYLINPNDFRLRLIKNNKRITSDFDAANIIQYKNVGLRTILKDTIAGPYTYYIKSGGRKNYHFRHFSIGYHGIKIINLKSPIFRYTFIFKDNIINKTEAHIGLWKNDTLYSRYKLINKIKNLAQTNFSTNLPYLSVKKTPLTRILHI